MSNSKRKSYDAKFKSRVALAAIKGEKTSAELSAMYGVHSTQITKWKKQAIEGLAEVFSKGRDGREEEDEKLQGELYKQIGQLKVELDWLKKKSGFNY